MRILTTLPQGDLNQVPGAVAAAEAAGFDGVMTMENRHDPFLALAVAATASERVELATAVAIAFPRSPMVVANTCWDHSERLPGPVRARHRTADPPPQREALLDAVVASGAPDTGVRPRTARDMALLGDRGAASLRGPKHYTFTLMTPNFTPDSTGQPMVPITIAAVGEHSLRLAGEVADGVRLHPFCTRRYLEEVCVKRIAEGMARTAGRTREGFEITGGGFLATGATDEEVDRAAEWVRYRVAFYGSTPGYWPVLELHGLGDLGRKLNRMTKEGAWDGIAAEIDDDTLRLFAAVGRHDEIAAAVETRFGGAADTIYASTSMDMRPDLPPDLIRDIQRLPTRFRGHTRGW